MFTNFYEELESLQEIKKHTIEDLKKYGPVEPRSLAGDFSIRN